MEHNDERGARRSESRRRDPTRDGNRADKRGQVRRMTEVVSTLLARRGYAQLQASEELETAWRLVAGASLSRDSRPARVRGGVLEVTVRNSVVLQELTFQKLQLLNRLAVEIPQYKVTDLRFRVGVIDY